MFHFTRKPPVHIVARFVDVAQAAAAKDAVTETLAHAEREVQSLYRRQNGIADSLEVGKIYERHGFTNDSGWRQERPLTTTAEELYWQIPDGMDLAEAKHLLVSFGALSVIIGGVDEEIPIGIPHPAAMYLAEMEDDLFDIDEVDFLFCQPQDQKKILH